MTVQHAIVAFPVFDAAEPIEAVRRAFDPQAWLLPAHITLVFPFVTSQDVDALRAHISTGLEELSSFDVTLEPPSVELDGYLFLRVESGRERIIDLHDRLYSGPLRAHLSSVHPYKPHVTVGRLHFPNALSAAITAARETIPRPVCATINSVSLFCIDGGAGRVEFTIPLPTREGERSTSARSASEMT